MSEHDRRGRWWSLSPLDISLMTLMSLGAACALTAITTAAAYRPCWGDIEPAYDAVLAEELRAEWPPGLRVEHEPWWYRGEVGREAGWRAAWLYDGTSCWENKVMIPVASAARIEGASLFRDPSSDAYRFKAAIGDRGTIVTFRRRVSPGHTLTNPRLRFTNLFVAAASVTCGVVGLIRRRGGTTSTIPLVLAAVLAIGAALFSFWH